MAVLIANVWGAFGSLGAELPQYRFEADQRYVYEVNIVAELPDHKETTSGHSFYTVKSVDEKNGQVTLRNFGSLRTRKQRKAGGRFRPRPLRPSFRGASYGISREVKIEPCGRVVRASGSTQLPFLLGNLWQLVLPQFPDEPQQTWERKREIRLVKVDRRFPFLRRLPNQETESRAAHESLTYALGRTTEDTATIEKKLRLATVEKIDGEPALEQTGQGKIEFDVQNGVPKSLTFKMTITSRTKQSTFSTPVTVSAQLLSKAEADEVWKKREAMLEAAMAKAKAKKAAAPEALTGDATDQALAGLKSPQWYKVKAACDQLAKAAPVEERRAEVAEALEGLLSHENGFVRPAAATALGVWGTEDSVSALVAALEEGDVLLKNAAVEALAKFDDQGAVEVVAEQVAVAALRFRAARALKAAGPRTEPAVLSLLGHSDRAVRMEACRILGAIGTDKSLESLRALLTDPNRSVAMNAKRAVQAIERRK